MGEVTAPDEWLTAIIMDVHPAKESFMWNLTSAEDVKRLLQVLDIRVGPQPGFYTTCSAAHVTGIHIYPFNAKPGCRLPTGGCGS